MHRQTYPSIPLTETIMLRNVFFSLTCQRKIGSPVGVTSSILFCLMIEHKRKAVGRFNRYVREG